MKIQRKLLTNEQVIKICKEQGCNKCPLIFGKFRKDYMPDLDSYCIRDIDDLQGEIEEFLNEEVEVIE